MRRDAGATEPMPEGAEAPPPGVRVMGMVRWALVAIAAAAAAGTWIWAARTDPAHASAGARFVCPMHPHVVQAARGSCPVCGMDLVAAGSQAPAAAVAPASPPNEAAPVAAAQGKYWCPMHPEVASDDPEARCEKCGGMKLLPRGEGNAAGVPGLAPVDVGAARAQLIGVRTAAVARRALRPSLRLPATIAVNESAVTLVASRVTGWVEELRVSQTGARVEKGQVLATIYSPELLTAQQVYLNVARAQGSAPGTSYPVDPTKRLDLLGIAKVDLEHLAKTGQVATALPIRAPTSGFVARRSVQAGQYLQPGAELFQLADLSTVWVLAEVPESALSRVAPGQPARAVVPAWPGEAFEGKVELVQPSTGAESRTTIVRVSLRNPAHRLRPGMTAEVELQLGSATALAVPAGAVVDTGEHRYAFVAKGAGRFEPRAVALGVRDGDAVEIREGLAEGEQVVTEAGFLVDSESRLRAALQQFEAGR